MTYISITFRKVGSLVISKVSSDDDQPIHFYEYKYVKNEPTRIISELQELIDLYDTEIVLINFPRDTKATYFNQTYGSLITLKKFGLINKITFINTPDKMYKRIHYYLNAGKKRNRSLNGTANLLLDGDSCWFYDNSVELTISNKSVGSYNMMRMGIIGLFYLVVKSKLGAK